MGLALTPFVTHTNWCPPQVTGLARKEVSLALAGLNLGVCVFIAMKQNEIQNKQLSLAKDWYYLAEDKWNRFESGFMPLEKDMIQEVRAEPKKEIQCDIAKYNSQSAVINTYNRVDNRIGNLYNQYRLYGYSRKQTALHRAKMLVDTENYNLADEAWYTDVRNDRRWARRDQVAGLGRGLSQMSLEYGQVANQAAGSASGMLGGFANIAQGQMFNHMNNFALAPYDQFLRDLIGNFGKEQSNSLGQQVAATIRTEKEETA